MGGSNLDNVWLQLENMIVQVSYQLLMKEKQQQESQRGFTWSVKKDTYLAVPES